MIKIGETNIKDVYIGDTPISKIYKGENLIYSKNQGNKILPFLVYRQISGPEGEVVKINNINELQETDDVIGIIVIPASHNVYGTGECGVMSIKRASTTTPDYGTSGDSEMYWGSFSADIAGVKTANVVARYGTMNQAQPSASIDGTAPYGCIPVMREGMNAKFPCPHDTKASYCNVSEASYGYLPSPYLNDNSRNPDYYKTTSPSSTSNCLADFNGKENTAAIIARATSQPNWRTDSTIQDLAGGNEYYPAACCCWRFKPYGTSQGDWYLPAEGELGYIAARYDLINKTIEQINQVISGIRVEYPLVPITNLHSSTEQSQYHIRNLDCEEGTIGYMNKESKATIYPFMRFNLNSLN